MTTNLSLVFDEDLHRDELDRFKTIPGCIGVSGYRNTVNLYFKSLSRSSLMRLALHLQERLAQTTSGVMLSNSTLDYTNSAQTIYHALREEAEI